MKQLILLAAFICASLVSFSQKVKVDANGNYVAVVSVRDSTESVNTGKIFTDAKGNTFPVMKSKNGKLFVIRISKNTGKSYPSYLTVTN
jgi:hypothetical protein